MLIDSVRRVILAPFITVGTAMVVLMVACSLMVIPLVCAVLYVKFLA